MLAKSTMIQFFDLALVKAPYKCLAALGTVFRVAIQDEDLASELVEH